MSLPAPAPSEPPARPVRATWAAMHGTPVRAVLDLDRAALERPLRNHLVMRCTACGVVGVDVYEREGGAVCALCSRPEPTTGRVVATLSAPRGAGPVSVTVAGEARELPNLGAGLDALAEAWAAETRPIARCRACGTPFVPKGRDGTVWTPDCGCAP